MGIPFLSLCDIPCQPWILFIRRFNSLIEFNFMNFHFPNSHHLSCDKRRGPLLTFHRGAALSCLTDWQTNCPPIQWLSRNNNNNKCATPTSRAGRMNSVALLCNSGLYCLLLSNLCSLNNFCRVPPILQPQQQHW